MPPTTDDVEAAAGRLRRLSAGEHADAVYAGMAHLGGAAFFVSRDTGTLAEAWLAANPGDDREPVTAHWVTTLLPAGWPGRRHAEYAGTLADVYRHTDMADPPGPRDSGAHFRLTVIARTVFPGADINWRLATRGQLRRLLAALGVPLPQGGAS